MPAPDKPTTADLEKLSGIVKRITFHSGLGVITETYVNCHPATLKKIYNVKVISLEEYFPPIS